MCNACRTHPCSVAHPLTWTRHGLGDVLADGIRIAPPRLLPFALNDRLVVLNGVFRIAKVDRATPTWTLTIERLP